MRQYQSEEHNKMPTVLETLILILCIIGALVVSSITGLIIDDEVGPNIFHSLKDTTEDNNKSMANVKVSPEERKRYLEELQRETTKTMIAALVFLVLLALIGAVGNTLVIGVYIRKLHRSATGVLIMTLSGFDLVANVIAIPGEIYSILKRWDFQSLALCKARLFCSAFTTISSALILLAIAVVRYRKVCHPHKSQITTHNAKVISVIISVLGALFSSPHAILNGYNQRETPRRDIVALGCGTDDNFEHTILPLLNYIFLLVLNIVCSIILIVMYILIGVTACKHRKFLANPNTVMPSSSNVTRKHESDALVISVNRNESNYASCRSPYNMNMDASITRESSIQGARNVGGIKSKRIFIGNNANEHPVQNTIHDSTDVGNPTVDVFFINLHKTNQGNTETIIQEKSQSKNTANRHTIIKGKSSREDARTSIITMIGNNNSNIKMRTKKSNHGDFVLNFKYIERYKDKLPARKYEFHAAKTVDATVDTFHSKVFSVITDLIYDKNVLNLNGEVNYKPARQSIQTAENEILNESELSSVFKWYEVFDIPNETTIFDSNCVQRATKDSYRLTLNNNLLQQSEGLKASVTEAIEGPAAISTENPRDNCLGAGSTVDQFRASTSTGSGKLPDSYTTNTTTVSYVNQDVLQRRVNKPTKNISLNTFGGSQTVRPLGKTTIIVLIITALYIISYLPHLTLMIFKFLSPEIIENLSLAGCILYNLFVRSYFLNCAVNPIVYSMRDDNFRRECKQICKIIKR